MYALAECAIELLYLISLLDFLGLPVEGPVEVFTDNKAAYDLCHRFTSAQHSKHIDRKLYKMRELRGAGVVSVRHISGEANPADLYTKVLGRDAFEKHRKFVLNLAGDTGAEYGKRKAFRDRETKDSSTTRSTLSSSSPPASEERADALTASAP